MNCDELKWNPPKSILPIKKSLWIPLWATEANYTTVYFQTLLLHILQYPLYLIAGLPTTTISLWPFVSSLLPRKHKHNCYCAQEVLSGLRQPVAVVHCGDGSQRLFVLEREGIVRVLNHNLELIKEPFLDIHKLVQSGLKVGMSQW